MQLVNPLAPVFEAFLQFYQLLPSPVRALVNLSLGLFLITCIISFIFRSSH